MTLACGALCVVFAGLTPPRSVRAGESAGAAAPAKPAAKPVAKPAAKGVAPGGLLDGLRMPSFGGFSLFLPKVMWRAIAMRPRLIPGEWYAYQVGQPNHVPSRLRISVIPSTRFKGPNGRILEIRVTRPTGGKSWVKMVLRGRLDRNPAILKLMLEQSTMPPMEIPIDTFGKPGDHTKVERPKTEIKGAKQARDMTFKRLGTEMVTTPAGRFETRHVRVYASPGATGARRNEGDIWVAPKVVHLWGIVKITTPKGQTLVLQDHGGGALTELPDFAPDPKAPPARAKAKRHARTHP